MNVALRQGTFECIIQPPRPPIPLDQAFPGVRARLILADPPWRYRSFSRAKHGAAAAHYSTMNLAELKALPVASIAADDSTLLLWCTQTTIFDTAAAVAQSWGFEPTTVGFVWRKRYRSGDPYMGLGYHTRSGAEFVLLAERGRGLNRVREDVLQVFDAPVGPHSVKPEIIFKLIDDLYGIVQPRIELFARRVRPGWAFWGNEVGPWAEVEA